MEMLNVVNSGSEVVGIINDNLEELGSDATVSASDSASAVCSTLNGVFDGVDDATELASSMSASDFVRAVNENFELAEEQDGGEGSLKILHWSDTHTNSYSTPKVKDLMNNDSSLFAVHTGDGITWSSGYSLNDAETVGNNYERFLMCTGNHDSYKSGADQSGAQKAATQKILAKVRDTQDSPIVWGDERTGSNKVASYYYRDITASGANKKVRFIVLDQYEQDVVGQPTNVTDTSNPNGVPYSKYDDIYSQAQIDWFLDTLESMQEDGVDYFIVVLHEPPVFDTQENKNALAAKRRANNFCAANFGANKNAWGTNVVRDYWDTHNGGIWPQIIDAYIKKTEVNFSFHNFNVGDPKRWVEDAEDPSVNENASYNDIIDVQADFSSQTSPAQFLFYMCGHMHREACMYLPQPYDGQLMLCVDCAKWEDAFGDLLRTSSVEDKFIINKVTVNFATRQTVIERIGLQDVRELTVDGVTYPSSANDQSVLRDKICFNFKKKNGDSGDVER